MLEMNFFPSLVMVNKFGLMSIFEIVTKGLLSFLEQ